MNLRSRADSARRTLKKIEQAGSGIPTSEITNALVWLIYERLTTYSHRNGETADPEIRGNYWVEINTETNGIEPAFWTETGWSTRYGGFAVPEKPFRIWGPIPYPEGR